MKIGVIVYSQTGNTYSVAEKIKEKLLSRGHFVNIERLLIIGDIQPNQRVFSFQAMPDIGKYDALVFAAPVQGFNLSPVMASYFTHLSPLNKIKTFCFVTQAFPFQWMGGKQAISRMKDLVEAKGGKVTGAGIVNWSSKKREAMITELAEGACGLF